MHLFAAGRLCDLVGSDSMSASNPGCVNNSGPAFPASRRPSIRVSAEGKRWAAGGHPPLWGRPKAVYLMDGRLQAGQASRKSHRGSSNGCRTNVNHHCGIFKPTISDLLGQTYRRARSINNDLATHYGNYVSCSWQGCALQRATTTMRLVGHWGNHLLLGLPRPPHVCQQPGPL